MANLVSVVNSTITSLVLSPETNATHNEPEAKTFSEATEKRKNRSLLVLCNKFLALYPLNMPVGQSMNIPLESLSQKMCLSRRRLYDIINIMESLQMAVKLSKNMYRWYGTRNVQKILSQLKDLSDQDMNVELDKLELASSFSNNEVPTQPPCTPQGEANAQTLLFRSLNPVPTQKSKKRRICFNADKSPEPKGPDAWKMKSLGGTCLKFLTLFFKHETVSLDWAGRVLLCGDDDSSSSSQSSQESVESYSQDSQGFVDHKEQDRQLRNKIRRIYDVANVLCALGLVCKVTQNKSASRKLLYAYCGPAIGNFTQNVISEPPKPNRQVKKVLDSEANKIEGQCKRRLNLGTKSDSDCKRKKMIMDEVLLELDESSSPFSVLLAVAEKERQGLNSESKAESQLSTSEGTFNHQPIVRKVLSPKRLSSQNQENSGKLILPKAPSPPNRSALRSLLENNKSSVTRYDFPAIKKFVVLNETRPLFMRPTTTTTDIRSPVQQYHTVLIKDQSGVIRRGTLSIPWQVNNQQKSTQIQLTNMQVTKSQPALFTLHKQT